MAVRKVQRAGREVGCFHHRRLHVGRSRVIGTVRCLQSAGVGAYRSTSAFRHIVRKSDWLGARLVDLRVQGILVRRAEGARQAGAGGFGAATTSTTTAAALSRPEFSTACSTSFCAGLRASPLAAGARRMSSRWRSHRPSMSPSEQIRKRSPGRCATAPRCGSMNWWPAPSACCRALRRGCVRELRVR